MEKFTKFEDKSSGTNPYIPNVDLTQITGFRKILGSLGYISLALFPILYLLSCIACGFAALFGNDELKHAIWVDSCIRPFIRLIGGDVSVAQSKKINIQKFEDVNMIFATNTSEFDVMFYSCVVSESPHFAFGLPNGGFIMFQKFLGAFYFARNWDSSAVQSTTEDGAVLDTGGRYFIGLDSLVSYVSVMGNKFTVVFPAECPTNGSVIPSFAKSVSCPRNKKFAENSIVNNKISFYCGVQIIAPKGINSSFIPNTVSSFSSHVVSLASMNPWCFQYCIGTALNVKTIDEIEDSVAENMQNLSKQYSVYDTSIIIRQVLPRVNVSYHTWRAFLKDYNSD